MSFQDTEAGFEALDRGTPRLSAMRDAIREADRQQDLKWQFMFRYDYIEESIFCGDRYYALIMFPELLELFDSHEALQEDGQCSHLMLITFRWIVEAVEEFPQITKEEIDRYFRLFKRRLQDGGHSLNIYYMKRGFVYWHIDRAQAAADFYRFLEAPLDEISDGRPLYYNHQVEYYLLTDQEEKAFRAAEPILSGKMRSSALPQSTYHKFLTYYIRKGDYDKAAHYAKLLEPYAKDNPYYLHNIGTLMSLYSQTDPAHGAQLLSNHLAMYLESKNPWMKVHFLVGAAHLAEQIRQTNAACIVRVPDGSEIPSDPDGMARYFYREAAKIAKRFDERNGTDDFMQKLLLLPVASE